jgi:hypothetical protein
MEDYQRDIWAALVGSKPGEVKIVSTGRRVGKSVFGQIVSDWNDMLERQQQPVITYDQQEVDGDTWYVVEVKPDVAHWIRTQNQDLWFEHDHKFGKAMFDVSGRLYTMLSLKW